MSQIHKIMVSRSNLAVRIGLATAILVGTAGTILTINKYSKKSETSLIQQDIQNLKKTYNSIDISSISDKERKWINNLNRKDLSKALKKELESEAWQSLDEICGLNNLSDKDCLFIYRTLKPTYEALGAFYMESMSD